MHRAALSLVAAALGFLLTGCITLGPTTVRPSQFRYNEAAAKSWNEQLLLNLVRLHYQDTPMFLELNQILASFSFDTAAGARGDIPPRTHNFFSAGSVSAGFRESPTLTYQPLQGDEFTRRMLSPIAAETLIMLSDAGWDGHLLMMSCVREINGLRNLPTSMTPEEEAPPTFEKFQQVSRLLRELQKRDELQLVIAGNAANASNSTLRIPTRKTNSGEVKELRKLLNLSLDQEVFQLTNARYTDAPNQIALSGRSLLGTLQFLSRYVDHPAAHTTRGVAIDTAARTTELSGPLLDIRSSKTRPPSAFCSVQYRDHWYYIADDDLKSKSTVGLLTQLFSLQARQDNGRPPLLTVPAR